MLKSTMGFVLELTFVPTSDVSSNLIQSFKIKPNNKISLVLNSKCREFALNSLQVKNSDRLLLHMYDMCRSKEAQVLIIKVKDTVALSSDSKLDFTYVVNKVSPRCWAWSPKKGKTFLTDLASVPGLSEDVSHVCLEGHSEWKPYAELI